MTPEIFTGLRARKRKAYFTEIELFGQGNKNIMDSIKFAVCKVTNILPEELESRCRREEIVTAKRLFCVFMIKYAYKKRHNGRTMTLARIGELIGLHHTSVIHHCKVHDNFLFSSKVEVELAKDIGKLIELHRERSKLEALV